MDIVDGNDTARQRMVDAYFSWTGKGKQIALVTSTNEEAHAINAEIQQSRSSSGSCRRSPWPSARTNSASLSATSSRPAATTPALGSTTVPCGW